MDKKTQQTFSRGSNKTLQQSDSSRKTNDSIQSSKPWPKNPRRRENKNLSSFNKPEAQRNGPGKNRLFVDKRPKPRSSFSNDPTSTSTSGLGVLDIAAESEGSIDYEIELNSIYTPGSKKQNLNHLLNFNYVPREDSHNVFGRFGGSGGNNYRKSNIKKPKYNKEQYLQANFQFVINTTADQHLLTSCPDTLIDWKLIEQINIQTTEEPQCPICLFPPIAAKLTRCGHVYCWPCILHYLALSDKTWRKCPICYEAVHHVDLKSTAIIQQSNFNVGSEITFKLMSRKKGSMVIEKGIPEKKGSEKIIHLSENNENRNFSKFLISDVSEILSIIEREKTELLFDQDPDCPEFVFIQQALGFLEQRKNEVLKEASYSSSSSIENINQLGSVDEENDKYYYFYQSEDAQNIFLHPLNIKMLQTMYNSLSEAPEVIKGKILQKESQSMDDILRRKFTCLGHLPLTCQFEIVEIEIKYPYVSKEVSDAFKDEIMLREKNRQRRAREEKKREKHINEINDRQMGKLIARSANIDINSDLQFPICGFDEPLSPNSGLDYPSSGSSAGASFANVMSSPKKEFWPTLGTPSQFQSFVEMSCVKPMNSSVKLRPEAPLDSDNEEQVSPTHHSIGDVLSEALQAKQAIKAAVGCSKKSKKSNKKTLLFSSGMNYKGN
ncbi:RNF10 family protein [Megaselia abdita]